MISMDKIAVIGDRESVLVFRAVGADVLSADGPDEARRAVDQAAKNGYGVIFLTEQLAAAIPETVARYRSQFKPAVILIPNSQGTLGIGMADISKNVEKAVGRNILN